MGTEGVWLQLTQSLDASSSLQAPPCSHSYGYLVFSTLSPLRGSVQIMWPLSLPCSGLGASFVVPPNGRTTHPSAFQLSFYGCWAFVSVLFCFFCCWLFYSCCPSGFISFFKKKSFLPLYVSELWDVNYACVQSSIFKWMEFIQSADLFLYQTLKAFRIWGNRKHCKSQPLKHISVCRLILQISQCVLSLVSAPKTSTCQSVPSLWSSGALVQYQPSWSLAPVLGD